MGGGAIVHVIGLAIGGLAAVKWPAIPGGNAGLDKALGGWQGIIGPSLYFVWALGAALFSVLATGGRPFVAMADYFGLARTTYQKNEDEEQTAEMSNPGGG